MCPPTPHCSIPQSHFSVQFIALLSWCGQHKEQAGSRVRFHGTVIKAMSPATSQQMRPYKTPPAGNYRSRRRHTTGAIPSKRSVPGQSRDAGAPSTALRGAAQAVRTDYRHPSFRWSWKQRQHSSSRRPPTSSRVIRISNRVPNWSSSTFTCWDARPTVLGSTENQPPPRPPGMAGPGRPSIPRRHHGWLRRNLERHGAGLRLLPCIPKRQLHKLVGALSRSVRSALIPLARA